MPVEIKELIIRAITTTHADAGLDDLPQGQDSAVDREAIIQECVRQVLRILKKKLER
ncbi:MAG: hypothetical protein KDJ52_00885 [Anaerolineae bacterium]|nr:hypothetical protein [Anaerolineae bacterium]